MFPAQRNARQRYPNQTTRQQNLMKAIQQWRNMSPGTVTAWNNFAAAYQQPTKRSATTFLTGYQLFLKRNHYCFLNHGIDSDFMLLPAMEELPQSEPIFEIKAGTNQIDVTELYLKNFGLLPKPGQWVLFHAIPYSDISGQFFTPIFATLEILEVFIDGLFLNLELPANQNNVTYSVYLSKPVYGSQSYAGTKIRYMGCFTTKAFLGLTDTPDSYTGQAGKNVIVKADESGLEFGEGGGGGLTCADLQDCPEIVLMNEMIANILTQIVTANFVSIPSIRYGLLYNFWAVTDPRNIAAVGWNFMIKNTVYVAIRDLYGGSTLAGNALKENDLAFWLSPNTGATNSAKFNMRGSGMRSYVGTFSYLKQRSPIWSLLVPQIYNPEFPTCFYSNTYWTAGSSQFKNGSAVRLVKDSTTLPEGGQGCYIGNNGRAYRTICIAGYEIMADNLAETIFRDGSQIPEVTLASDWAALSTAGMCAYNNDWSNV